MRGQGQPFQALSYSFYKRVPPSIRLLASYMVVMKGNSFSQWAAILKAADNIVLSITVGTTFLYDNEKEL